MWYQAYLDSNTGKMLIAVPGGSFSMTPVDAGLPVPPSDGRWADIPAPPPAAKPAVSAPAPAPAPEGGDE